MADRVGQRLGNYHLTHLLGKGGFAEVYLGQHVRLGTQAAIKLLLTRLVGQEYLDRFQREAQTIAHLDHPHIVRVLDFDVVDETPFLVMSYAPNGSLRQRHPRGTHLPLQAVVAYVQQVAEALQYGHHQRLIHRDVKPENLLLNGQGEVLLSDFGIAVVAETTSRQRTQEFSGTAAYAAPEQLQGKPQLASDQYALGIVVYEWLTGACPFQGSYLEVASQHVLTPPTPLRERNATILPAVEQVVLTALEKDPRVRFASVRAFATALSQASQPAQSMLLAPTRITPSALAPAQVAAPLQSASFASQPAVSESQPALPVEKALGEGVPGALTRNARALAFLSYLLFSISGLVILSFKRNQHRFLHFHALQAVFLTLFLAVFIGALAIGLASTSATNTMLQVLLVAAIALGVGYWLLGMIQAARGKRTRLFPVGYLAAFFARKNALYNVDRPPPFPVTRAGWSERLLCALSYLLLGLPGPVYLLFLRKNRKKRFVRFHALQSILFFLPMAVLTVASIGTILLLLAPVIVVGWGAGIYCSLRGRYYRLPFVGSFVEGRVARNNKLI